MVSKNWVAGSVAGSIEVLNSDRIIMSSELKNSNGKILPYVVVSPSLDTAASHWVCTNRDLFENNLIKYGSVLLRGFKKCDVSDFERFIQETSGNLLSYRNRSTPRTMISGKIYTSTEYPADQTIPQHNENSYTHEWPKRLFFCCLIPPEFGGQTPISDSRMVFQRLPDKIKSKFEQHGVPIFKDIHERTWPYMARNISDDRSNSDAEIL